MGVAPDDEPRTRETHVRQRTITRKIIVGYAVQCVLLAATGTPSWRTSYATGL